MLFLEMDKISKWGMGVLRVIEAWISRFIYELIAWVYELLFKTAGVRLLNRNVCVDSLGNHILDPLTNYEITLQDRCQELGGTFVASPITLVYQRVTLLLAIIMVFFVTFQFVKYLFVPEEMADKEKGVERLGFKLLTVVALLAASSTAFA